MSEWATRVEQHELSRTVETVLTHVETVRSKITDTDGVLAIDRIRHVTEYVKRALRGADPLLIPLAALNTLQSHFNSVVAELEAFGSNGNAGHLKNANTQLENVLVQLAYVPQPSSIEEIDLARDSVSSFRKSAGQHQRYLDEELKTLRSTASDVRTRLDQMTQEIASQKARLDTAISQFQSQFSDAEARRSEQFATAERDRTQKHSDAIQSLVDRTETATQDAAAKVIEWQKNADERLKALTDRAKTATQDAATKVTEWQSKAEERLTAVVENGEAQLSASTKDLEDRAEKTLTDLGELKRRAEELVSVITNTGNVAGFQRVADQHRKTARTWQVVAVVSFAGLITFAIMLFFSAAKGTVEWPVFTARVFVSATFGILAAYAARQADKNEEAERRNRKLELELASIDPFIVGLPETARHEVKRELASRLFGQEAHKVAVTPETTGSVIDILKLAIEALTEVAKKK